MALVNPTILYQMVENKKMAIGAFNVHNMEYTQAVVWAAELENAPVILMIGEPILEFATFEMISTITLKAARDAKVPISVILDHGKKPENIKRCLDLGISVMFDGSDLSFAENIQLTKDFTDYAHKLGLSIEGELGSISGAEDSLETSQEKMTPPNLVREYTEKTGIDALAVSIGNVHGKYTHPPKLDFDILEKIKAETNLPIVLHGGSDLPDELSTEAINHGVKKFNIGTDLKYAMCESLKRTLNNDPMPFQPQSTFGVAREDVMLIVQKKIRLFKNGGEYEEPK